MRCPKCSGQMEINRIRTHLVWVDELDRIPKTSWGQQSLMYARNADT